MTFKKDNLKGLTHAFIWLFKEGFTQGSSASSPSYNRLISSIMEGSPANAILKKSNERNGLRVEAENYIESGYYLLDKNQCDIDDEPAEYGGHLSLQIFDGLADISDVKGFPIASLHTMNTLATHSVIESIDIANNIFSDEDNQNQNRYFIIDAPVEGGPVICFNADSEARSDNQDEGEIFNFQIDFFEDPRDKHAFIARQKDKIAVAVSAEAGHKLKLMNNLKVDHDINSLARLNVDSQGALQELMAALLRSESELNLTDSIKSISWQAQDLDNIDIIVTLLTDHTVHLIKVEGKLELVSPKYSELSALSGPGQFNVREIISQTDMFLFRKVGIDGDMSGNITNLELKSKLENRPK